MRKVNVIEMKKIFCSLIFKAYKNKKFLAINPKGRIKMQASKNQALTRKAPAIAGTK